MDETYSPPAPPAPLSWLVADKRWARQRAHRRASSAATARRPAEDRRLGIRPAPASYDDSIVRNVKSTLDEDVEDA